MKTAALVILLLLSGCTAPTDHESAEPSKPAPPTTWEQILDTNWTMVNDSPHFVVEDEAVTTLEVNPDVLELQVNVTQVEKPAFSAFTYGARLYGPNGSFAQETFVLNEVHFRIQKPEAGSYSLTYFTDELMPLGRHTLHVVARTEISVEAVP